MEEEDFLLACGGDTGVEDEEVLNVLRQTFVDINLETISELSLIRSLGVAQCGITKSGGGGMKAKLSRSLSL